jgi:hypothetical protein
MKTLLERYGESWRAAGRDVTLIVVSILIAFTLEAWWQGGRDRTHERDHLQALVNEFRATLSQLEGQLAGLENSLDGTLTILELMGPSPSAIAPSDLSAEVVRSFNWGGFSSDQTTLESMLASGELVSSERDSLSVLLERWPAMANSLRVDSGHLERNREEDILGSLVRLGVPISVLVQARDLGIPESEFSLDAHTLLSDVGLESVFTIRAIRSQLLANDYRTAIEDVETIIRLLEGELGGSAG